MTNHVLCLLGIVSILFTTFANGEEFTSQGADNPSSPEDPRSQEKRAAANIHVEKCNIKSTQHDLLTPEQALAANNIFCPDKLDFGENTCTAYVITLSNADPSKWYADINSDTPQSAEDIEGGAIVVDAKVIIGEKKKITVTLSRYGQRAIEITSLRKSIL